MQVTRFPIRRHSPSNLHVFVSHRNRSVSRSSKPGGSNQTLVNVPQQLNNTHRRSAVFMNRGSRRKTLLFSELCDMNTMQHICLYRSTWDNCMREPLRKHRSICLGTVFLSSEYNLSSVLISQGVVLQRRTWEPSDATTVVLWSYQKQKWRISLENNAAGVCINWMKENRGTWMRGPRTELRNSTTQLSTAP